MILTYNYWFFKKVIPIKTCNEILKACRKKFIEQSSTFNGIDKTKRNCKIAWINDKWIYDIINPLFMLPIKKQVGILNGIGTNLHNSLFMKKVSIMVGTQIKAVIL